MAFSHCKSLAMTSTETTVGPPVWARALFAGPLAPSPEAGVWTLVGEAPSATISEQFKAEAEAYHRRYGASDHFEALFRQALTAARIAPPEAPLVLDVGSGSGVNSVIPLRRMFPGAQIVSTDLSHQLLGILARGLEPDAPVACVAMDAASPRVRPGVFDLVTGAAILHHLVLYKEGIEAAARALKPGGHAVFLEPFEGYGLIRLAYEQILVEAELRRARLAPDIDRTLKAMIADIAARTHPDPHRPGFADLDDKWLFSRELMELTARKAGFSQVRFVAHNDHPTLYRDVALIQLKLATGREDLQLPGWALAVLDRFDRAMPAPAKRLMMLEGSIVLTKGD